MRQVSYASFTDERRIADFDPSGHRIRRLLLCGNEGTPQAAPSQVRVEACRRTQCDFAGRGHIFSDERRRSCGVFATLAFTEHRMFVHAGKMHRPAYRTARRATGSGVGSVLLALEFVERCAIGAVLRGLGHAALGRDLRAEVAWLHEHDVNAKRARL
jgi:hypothetical protein